MEAIAPAGSRSSSLVLWTLLIVSANCCSTTGMMLVPLINIVVGLIVGAWLAGPAGALVGLALAVLIAAIEKWAGDRLGWFEPNTTTAEETVRTPCRRLLTCEGPLRAEQAATEAKAALRC